MISRKRMTARLCILTLALLSPLAAWRIWITSEVNRQLALIRAAGLPVNGEELNRWYPAVPDAQNAALLLTQAFELRRNYSDSRSNLTMRLTLPDRRQPLSAQQAELMEGYVAMNAPMLALADEALNRPASRYPIDCAKLMDTELPHLAWLKDLAEIHQCAAYLKLQPGGGRSASSNLVVILALSRTLDNEPCMISQLVRLRLFKMAFCTLERRASAEAFGVEELDQLAAAFRQTQLSNVVARALIGERAMVIPYFRMTRAERNRLSPPRNPGKAPTEPGHPETIGLLRIGLRLLLVCNGQRHPAGG
jgi:hypothetical protein